VGVITDPENWQMLQQDPIRLVVVDERPIVRAGVVACLRGEADLDLVGDFDTLSHGLLQDETARADVVLLGYQYRTSVTDGVAELSRINDGIKVLVLSHCGGDARARMAIDAGAHGFMPASARTDELAAAVRVVARGQRFLDNATAIDLANRTSDGDLRPKEVEVLRHVAEGRANKWIAVELSTTEAGVKNHIKRILAKLGAADRTHAVIIAVRRGIIDVNQ
jgi:DNA-binding NarL/FixJ family response regulator